MAWLKILCRTHDCLRAYGAGLVLFVCAILTKNVYANLGAQQMLQPPSLTNLPVSVVDKLALANIATDDISVSVVRLSDNKPIIAHLNAQDRKPASTQKIIPTALALKVLGEDFAWHTPVYYKGVLYDGVLYGDLIIKGSGDPSLTYDKLRYLLALVVQKVRHITGNIYIDNSLFSYVGFDGYRFDGQGTRAYNASPSAFLVNFGTVEIRFLPSGVTTDGLDKSFAPNDGRAALRLLPDMDGVSLNQTSVIQTQGCHLPNIKMTANHISIEGSFGAECGTQSIWRNFNDNDKLASMAIKSAWRWHDKQFDAKVQSYHIKSAQGNGVPLVVMSSAPLKQQIWQINQFSNNVMTEQLALSLPIYGMNESVSSYNKSLILLKKYLNSLGAGQSAHFSRASGLCHDCTVRADDLMAVLQDAASLPQAEVFIKSLPEVGRSGTMLRLKNSNHPAVGRAWIKTGTLNDVAAQAGYVRAHNNVLYGYVAIINHKGTGYDKRAIDVLDELLRVVVLQP